MLLRWVIFHVAFYQVSLVIPHHDLPHEIAEVTIRVMDSNSICATYNFLKWRPFTWGYNSFYNFTCHLPNSPSLISSTPCQCVQEFNLQIFLLNLLGTEGFTRQIVSPLLQNLTWSGLHLKSTLLNSKELKGHLVEAKFTFLYQKYAQYVGRYIIHDACGIDPHVVVSSWISNLQHPNITREKWFVFVAWP